MSTANRFPPDTDTCLYRGMPDKLKNATRWQFAIYYLIYHYFSISNCGLKITYIVWEWTNKHDNVFQLATWWQTVTRIQMIKWKTNSNSPSSILYVQTRQKENSGLDQRASGPSGCCGMWAAGPSCRRSSAGRCGPAFSKTRLRRAGPQIRSSCDQFFLAVFFRVAHDRQ